MAPQVSYALGKSRLRVFSRSTLWCVPVLAFLRRSQGKLDLGQLDEPCYHVSVSGSARADPAPQVQATDAIKHDTSRRLARHLPVNDGLGPVRYGLPLREGMSEVESSRPC